MKIKYTDPYIACPFYAYEESSQTRKLHCEGYRKGVHLHIYFASKELKKVHKMKFCKKDYQNCPLYHTHSTNYQEEDDE